MEDFTIENNVLVKYHGNASEVIVPEGITAIGEKAFMDCDNLKKIRLPDSLIEIKSQAFCNCFSLSDIIIPDSVKKIENKCFWYCNIKNFNHPQLKIENGFVIKDNCLQYLSISDEKNIIIPDTVTSIGDSAFLDSIMESIVIPSTC